MNYLKYLFILAQIVTAIETVRAGEGVPLSIKGIRIKPRGAKKTVEYRLVGKLEPVEDAGETPPAA
jgi:hypothetical protein